MLYEVLLGPLPNVTPAAPFNCACANMAMLSRFAFSLSVDSGASVCVTEEPELYLSHLCFLLFWSNRPVLALQLPGKLHSGGTVLWDIDLSRYHRKF